MNTDTQRSVSQIASAGWYREGTALGEGGWPYLEKEFQVSQWKRYELSIPEEDSLLCTLTARSDIEAYNGFKSLFNLENFEHIIQRVSTHRVEIHPPLDAINSKEQLIQTIKNTGSYFFSKDTMRFFRSRVYDHIFHVEDGRVLFITSERQDSQHPRLYTVRAWNGKTVKDVGGFQAHQTLRQAVRAAKRESR